VDRLHSEKHRIVRTKTDLAGLHNHIDRDRVVAMYASELQAVLTQGFYMSGILIDKNDIVAGLRQLTANNATDGPCATDNKAHTMSPSIV
jgi:hypothetical protein